MCCSQTGSINIIRTVCICQVTKWQTLLLKNRKENMAVHCYCVGPRPVQGFEATLTPGSAVVPVPVPVFWRRLKVKFDTLW